jgi:hypothetical protein
VRHVDYDNLQLRDGVRIFIAEQYTPSTSAPPAVIDQVCHMWGSATELCCCATLHHIACCAASYCNPAKQASLCLSKLLALPLPLPFLSPCFTHTHTHTCAHAHTRVTCVTCVTSTTHSLIPPGHPGRSYWFQGTQATQAATQQQEWTQSADVTIKQWQRPCPC